MTEYDISTAGSEITMAVISSMNESSHPLVSLIRSHMKQKGIDRKTLGHRLATNGNKGKAFRRLDETLQAKRFLPETVRKIASALEIPDEQLLIATEAQGEFLTRLREKENERRWRADMARRGPHLWAKIRWDSYPSLITIVGPEPFLMTLVPDSVTEGVSEWDHLAAIGRFVAQHHGRKERSRVLAYEYRRSVDEIHLFSIEGEWQGELGIPWVEHRVRVGGKDRTSELKTLLRV